MSGIMKIIDGRGTQKNKQTKKKQRQKRLKGEGNASYNERVRAKWFCCVFKLGSFQIELL